MQILRQDSAYIFRVRVTRRNKGQPRVQLVRQIASHDLRLEERERERDIIRDFISAASANIDIGDHLSIYVSLGDVSERDTGDANRVF